MVQKYVKNNEINSKGKPITNKKITFKLKGKTYTAKVDPQGTIYTIPGCAGVKYYVSKDNALTDELFPRAEKIVDSQLPAFASIRIEGNKLFFDAYNVDGSEAIGICCTC